MPLHFFPRPVASAVSITFSSRSTWVLVCSRCSSNARLRSAEEAALASLGSAFRIWFSALNRSFNCSVKTSCSFSSCMQNLLDRYQCNSPSVSEQHFLSCVRGDAGITAPKPTRTMGAPSYGLLRFQPVVLRRRTLFSVNRCRARFLSFAPECVPRRASTGFDNRGPVHQQPVSHPGESNPTSKRSLHQLAFPGVGQARCRSSPASLY